MSSGDTMQDPQVAELVAAAGAAAAAGRWDEAERCWRRVRDVAPRHPQALYSLGVHAYQRGDTAEALAQLQAARLAAPADPMIVLTLGVVLQARGDLDGEWEAIGAALALDPYFLPALLAKADFLQARGRRHAAAAVYRDALNAAPAEPQWPPALRRRLALARQRVAEDAAELGDYLHAALAGPRTALDAVAQGRWDEAIAIATGRSRPYHSQSNRLLVPRLPGLTFYDEALFPWIPALEAQTEAIAAELLAALRTDDADFTPYVAYAPGQPVNQWQALNHSRAWSSYHLWAHGQPVHEHLARCPATAAALAQVDAARIDGLCPNAMFSVLAPHTAIPPHHGETNARLVAHLPLVVPAHCRFRVGYDWREWQPGKVLVFDDSIEHEARNDSDEIRVVMIFDVWNPFLSLAERAVVQAMEQAVGAYRAAGD